MLSTVVLPAPFGPMMLVTAPGSAVTETPSAARMPPKLMPIPVITRGAPAAPPSSAAGSPPGRVRRSGGRGSSRARLPTMPAGTSQSTTRVATPKNSSRYSASPARLSGSRTVTRAPNRGPSTVPAPPTTTERTNRIDCVKGKELGAMNSISGGRTAPASPVSAAEIAKASVFTRTGSKPREAAATSASRTARIARPSRLRRRAWKA